MEAQIQTPTRERALGIEMRFRDSLDLGADDVAADVELAPERHPVSASADRKKSERSGCVTRQVQLRP